MLILMYDTEEKKEGAKYPKSILRYEMFRPIMTLTNVRFRRILTPLLGQSQNHKRTVYPHRKKNSFLRGRRFFFSLDKNGPPLAPTNFYTIQNRSRIFYTR